MERVGGEEIGLEQMGRNLHLGISQHLPTESPYGLSILADLKAILRLWDLGQQRCVHSYAVHTDSVWALASTPTFSPVYSGGRDLSLYLTDLGYWLVRKYVISEDGDVDVGVAQFIKWSMRVIAVTCIFLSSNDTPLALAAVGSCLVLYYMITSLKWHDYQAPQLSKKSNRWQFNGQRTPNTGRAEFLRRPKKTSPLGSPWNGPRNSFAWSDSPAKGTVNTSQDRGSTGSQRDFYSTFHKTPNRKKYSKEEWEEFTEESTRESVAELASSPEFTDWVIKNANRIKLLPDNGSDDDASGSDSTDGHLVKKAARRGFFSW